MPIETSKVSLQQIDPCNFLNIIFLCGISSIVLGKRQKQKEY